MKEKLILSAYGSHNAAIAMYYKGEYRVIEVERWLNSKNIGLTTYMPSKHPQIVFDEITEYLLSTTDRSDVDIYLTDYVQNIIPKFHIKESHGYDHHTAHAATAFYQSPYKEALVFTFDGGGDGGFFNVYLANRQNGIKLLDKFNQDLGFPYMIICDYLKDIKKEPLNIGNLVYAGKIMGLCSYGKIREEWIPHFETFYEKFNYIGSSYLGGKEVSNHALTELFSSLGIEFDYESSRYEGELAWDIATTSQKAFENQFFKYAQKYLNQYPNMPVAMAGGCALNVLLNTKLLKLRNNNVFIPPNVNDCGIAVGGLLWYQNPENQIDLTYSGTPILDKNQFGTYIQEYDLVVHEDVTLPELAKFISEGNIVGLIQGNSEHGSRALGNRSIICNPVGDMKNVLNNKVKHREWYRPFAPMVRLEDTPKYFEFDEVVESRHMIFVADVREEWREKLPAITHQDNTARLQTVTRNQNPLIYDLLGELEKFTGHGVLLNTSFNVDGKPILSRLSDAFKILRETELDAVYYEGKLILKHMNDTFHKSRKITPSTILTNNTTVNIMSFKDTDVDIQSDIEIVKNLIREDRNVVVMIPKYHHHKYIKFLPESKSLSYFLVDTYQHYYDQRIKLRPDFTLNTTTQYAKLVKLLWCREVVQENCYNSKYHLFINLDELKENEYSNNIAREVDILSDFSQTDNQIIITAKKKLDSIFSNEYIFERFNATITAYPTTAMFGGNVENLEWMFNNYEGEFLWYTDMGKIGKDYDYLLISSIENISRYKFLDS